LICHSMYFSGSKLSPLLVGGRSLKGVNEIEINFYAHSTP
jgi:hypothetical protein